MRAMVPTRAYPLAHPGDEEDAAVPGDGAVGRVTALVGLEREGHDHLRQHDPGVQGQQGRRWASTSGVASGLASVIGGLQWISVITPLREIHNRPQPVCIPDTLPSDSRSPTNAKR